MPRTHVEFPPNSGSMTSVEWNLGGTGDFVKQLGGNQDTRSTGATYTYRRPGTYYSSVRVAVHREGDAKSQYA